MALHNFRNPHDLDRAGRREEARWGRAAAFLAASTNNDADDRLPLIRVIDSARYVQDDPQPTKEPVR